MKKTPKAPKAPRAKRPAKVVAEAAPAEVVAEAAAPAEAAPAPFVGPKGGVPKITNVGRSKFSGTIFSRTEKGRENPRRPGTYGRRAFDYLPEFGKGIRYEALAEKIAKDALILGGLNHLNYDLEKGFTTSVPAASFVGEVVE